MFLPWLIAAGLVTADDLVHSHRFPLPYRFLASFAVFGVLGVIAEGQGRGPAALIGWGLDVALFYRFVSTGKAPVLSQVGDFLLQSGSAQAGTGTQVAPASRTAQPSSTTTQGNGQGVLV